MTSLLVKILKIALFVFLAIVIVLAVFGLVLVLNWPWWMALFLLAILAGMGVGWLFLRKILARKKEQRFVQDVIAQDEARIQSLSAKERDEMKELQDRWKETVDMLRRSHLKKQGNPLYVLPWYMVIGESGSGKTTAISSARLASPFAEVKRVQGISGTKNCDWWFFEQAVVIDTAGRYAIPVDEGRDKDEWQKFLTLLLKYRKKEPLHGLIVTIAADKLLSAPPEALEEDGKSIRRRIDELMRVLGVKFPVYALVTKCDLIQGMAKFSDQLPEKTLDQPMGYINQGLTKDVGAFLLTATSTIAERLKNIRLLLLHQPKSKTVDPALLLFPEEFEQLAGKLGPFMKGAFEENPYQETPILRGLFFSSGHQEGTPYSHFLEALRLIDEKEVLPGTSKGLFLHEFFSRVLPSDRQLFAPTTRSLEWQTLTRNLGLTAWLLFGIAVCGLVSFSFVKNLHSIRSVTRELAQPPVMTGRYLTDLVTMDRFRGAVAKLEKENHNWWIPRFGLNESLKVETSLKDRYCKQFHGGFLAPFDKQTQEVMPRLVLPTASSDTVGQYIVHLVRRINLLKARLDGGTFDTLKQKPQPSYVSIMPDQTAGLETRNKFGNLYLSYILWRRDTGDINKEVVLLQAWLRELLSTRGASFDWLFNWVDRDSGVPAITLADFWGGSITLPDEKRINPVFTRKGRDAVYSFLKEVEMALADPAIFESQKANLDKRYRTMAFETWQNFAVYFPKGAGRLKGAKEWEQMAPKMASDQGPYLGFINKATAELEPLSGEGMPVWLQQLYQLQLAKAQGQVKDQGTVAKAAETGKKLVASIEKQIGKEGAAQSMESQIAAGKAYQEMVAALTTIAPVAASRAQAHQMAVQAFTEDPNASKSPFYAADGAASRLKASLGQGRPVDETVSRLISGPEDFLWTTVRMEAGCHLQAGWEEKVLAEAQGATGPQAAQILLAPEGPVWKFVKGTGPAAAFIGWNPKRNYYAKEALGGSIPFDPAFFPFLVRGAKVSATAQVKQREQQQGQAPQAQQPQSYNVTINALPTDANADATVKPHATKLDLQCATGPQSLANFQFQAGKTFKWIPDGCGDVTFQIEVGDVVLFKKYSGPMGFPQFLKDFRGGRHTFIPKDFPGEAAALNKMGIKYIKVNYQFMGDGPVIAQAGGGGGGGGGGKAKAKAEPEAGPAARAIAKCWAQ